MSTPSAPVTPERIFQLAWGFAPPLVLEAAIRNRVFDVLDAGPMTVEQIAQATGASVRGLSAILNVLVGLNFLAPAQNGSYALTAESAAFLVSTKPSFQGGLIKHTSNQLIPNWLHLSDVVKSGKPTASVNQEGQGAAFFQELVPDIFPMSYPAAQELAAHLHLTEGSRSILPQVPASGASHSRSPQPQSASQPSIGPESFRSPKDRRALRPYRPIHVQSKAN